MAICLKLFASHARNLLQETIFKLKGIIVNLYYLSCLRTIDSMTPQSKRKKIKQISFSSVCDPRVTFKQYSPLPSPWLCPLPPTEAGELASFDGQERTVLPSSSLGFVLSLARRFNGKLSRLIFVFPMLIVGLIVWLWICAMELKVGFVFFLFLWILSESCCLCHW